MTPSAAKHRLRRLCCAVVLSHIHGPDAAGMSAGGDAAAPRARWAEVATSGFSSISRLPFGTTVGPGAAARSREPAQTLQLFEFEACPFCRQADAPDA